MDELMCTFSYAPAQDSSKADIWALKVEVPSGHLTVKHMFMTHWLLRGFNC
jgi:hypothetical protein